MDERDTSQTDHGAERREGYLLGGGDSERITTTVFAARTAINEASFFVPHLRSNMSVLDCGCGPGTITVGLAEIVAPGQVIGIDVDPVVITQARKHAREKDVDNVRFETGSIYALAFPNESFDGVFAHGVMEHLRDPLAALVEMQRVLKPGGILGVRSTALDGMLMAPADPLLLYSHELRERMQRHKGGEPHIGKHFRSLLHRAGLSRIQATASYDCFADESRIQQLGDSMAWWYSEGQIGDELVQLGWTDRETLAKIADAWRAWAKEPGAFNARSWCEAVGWKD